MEGCRERRADSGVESGCRQVKRAHFVVAGLGSDNRCLMCAHNEVQCSWSSWLCASQARESEREQETRKQRAQHQIGTKATTKTINEALKPVTTDVLILLCFVVVVVVVVVANEGGFALRLLLLLLFLLLPLELRRWQKLIAKQSQKIKSIQKFDLHAKWEFSCNEYCIHFLLWNVRYSDYQKRKTFKE